MLLLRSLSIVSILTASPSFAWTNWVGVLEDWPIRPNQISASADEKKSVGSGQEKSEVKNDTQYEARVRPLFVRIDKKPWQAAPRLQDSNPVVALPKAFSWDVCFGGRAEGQLTAMLEKENEAGAKPPYLLRPEDRAPWRTKRSADYAGWLATPVYKPILLKSSLSSSCVDPYKWRQATADKSRPHLKQMIDELNKKMASPESEADFYQFNEKDVRIHRTWASVKHGLIVSIQTLPKSRKTETFRVLPSKEIHYLGSDMMLVDAGDFDGDGETEMLFKRHTESQDIYDLYSDTKLLAESVWE